MIKEEFLNLKELCQKDLNQYYKGSFIRYKDNPLFVEQVSIADSTIVFCGSVSENNTWLPAKLKLDAGSFEDFNTAYPDLGFINLNSNSLNTAIYVERIPYKQWCRGFSENTYTYNTISGNDLRGVGKPRTVSTSSLEFIETIFKPTYYTLEEAINLILSRKAISVALNKHFAVAATLFSTYPVVYYKKWPIGKYLVKKKEVRLIKEVEHVKQELSELCKVS